MKNGYTVKQMNLRKKIFLIFCVITFSSCSKLGWGILLWSVDEPPIPSGTVMPVYIRSNIDRVWVVGVPDSYRKDAAKVEVPLHMFEFSGSKKKAQKRAYDFMEYSIMYAENLQDGLPIRENPDNNARRVYRLRVGEIIKILTKVNGVPAISATGEPLVGDWYRVLTKDGAIGYCFSYRLKLFDHENGLLASQDGNYTQVSDPNLDMVMSYKWSPEVYLQMVNTGRFNIADLEKNWRFDPGQDTGIALLSLPNLKKEFVYKSINPDGERAWIFEGTTLQMHLRTNTTLIVQFNESNESRQTYLFSALSTDVDDLILQENTRREDKFSVIIDQGPVYTSNNYGVITFSPSDVFTWTGYDLLVPNLIPESASGRGSVLMDLYLMPSFEERFNGACTFHFTDTGTNIRFMYSLDNQGLRLEVVPDYAIEEITVTRRSSSPMVLYFYTESSN
jgi:hypothetical protein